MLSTPNDLREFKELITPLIKFLQLKYDPHTTIIVSFDRAAIFQGKLGTGLLEVCQECKGIGKFDGDVSYGDGIVAIERNCIHCEGKGIK